MKERSQTAQEKDKKIVISAALMSLGTLISRILGLIRDILLSNLFPKAVTDVFFVAFRLPQFFRRLFGEGALSQSFVPLFTTVYEKSTSKAKEFLSSVLTLLFLSSTVISALAVWQMEALITLLTSQDIFSEEKFQDTVAVSRILFPYLIFVLLFAFYMSTLNSLKKFFLPGLTPAFLNLALITFSIIAHFQDTLKPHLLAVGVLCGGFLQTLCLAVAVYKKGLLVWPSFRWPRNKVFWSFCKKLLPATLGLGVLQLMSLINLYFASSLEEGVISFLYYGERLLELPRSLIAVSLGTALLPTLSQFFKEQKKLTEVLQNNLNLLMYLTLPAALGLYFLAQPLVQTIFMRGFFTSYEVLETTKVVKGYSLLLIALNASTVLSSGFYAFRNTLFPALSALFTVTLHFFIAGFLVESFSFSGLIGANIISAFFNFFVLFFGYQWRIHAFSYKLLFQKLTLFLVPLLSLGLFLYVLQKLPISLFFLLVQVVAAGGVYFGVSYALKIPELHLMLNRKKKRS